ncbi:MAG: glycosyltransferase [Candidatus Acidiferrales bacterium]
MGLYVVSVPEGKLINSYERSARVALVTSALSVESLPHDVVAASDSVILGNSTMFSSQAPPDGADGIIGWLAGERLLQGDTAAIRRALVGTPSRNFVPVHYPCLEELDLIALEPRLVTSGASIDRVCTNIRISASAVLDASIRESISASQEPWAKHSAALLSEADSPGRGIDSLSRLWLEERWHPILASLLLRNLIVLMIRHDRFAEARDLARQGGRAFPRNAELSYIQALLAAGMKSAGEAVGYLKRATGRSDSTFVGSGGERSYRAHWLLGKVFEPSGKQGTAVDHFRAGFYARPAFGPAIAGLLRQRVPTESAYRLRLDLCPLARREPKYFEPIFYFLLLHRQIEAAGRLLRLAALTPEDRTKYGYVFDSVAATYSPRRPASDRRGVILTGAFLIISSLARANRELALHLMRDRDLDVALEPHGMGALPTAYFPEGARLLQGLYSRPAHCDLTIRHHWPPDFRRPICGKLVNIVPWEYGAVPTRWVREINQNVDELWVPSEFVRFVFLTGGVSPQKLRVIPYGVDAEVFRPDGSRWRPEGCRGFAFLFVGGVIERKGLDLLAEAYETAFRPSDDVTLIIKDQGSSTFYRHSKLLRRFQRMARSYATPHVIVITKEMEDAQLAALYRGCDAFVLPYRGEGFGMPLAEALACGKPVITTGLGPAREFCPESASYFIDATAVPMLEPPNHLGPLANDCTWFEPNVTHFAETMRYVYEHRDEVAQRASPASAQIRASYSWSGVVARCRERIRDLLGMHVGTTV